jgi:hypothetical protein
MERIASSGWKLIATAAMIENDLLNQSNPAIGFVEKC